MKITMSTTKTPSQVRMIMTMMSIIMVVIMIMRMTTMVMMTTKMVLMMTTMVFTRMMAPHSIFSRSS